MTDQQRWDALAGAGRFPVRTPTLDRLAAEGVWFRRSYCQSPLCVPSRTSFLTGRYPHQHQCLDNETSVWPEAPSFVRALRDIGYHTANVGKLHYTWFHDLELLVTQPLLRKLGFVDPYETTGKMSQGNLRASAYSEHLQAKGLLEPYHADLLKRSAAGPLESYHMRPSILDEEDHIDGWVLRRAQRWLTDVQDDPFFLWIGPPGPHDPFDPPAPYADLYRPEDMPLGPLQYRYPVDSDAISTGIPDATPEQIQQMRTQYLANVTFIDAALGRIMDVLERRRLLATTWIFFCSDHGEMLGDHRLIFKGQFFEPAVRVPLLVRPPDGLPARRGAVSDALVELLDVPSTMLNVAGTALDGDQGRSLLPLLESAESDPLDVHRDLAVSAMGERLMLTDGHHKVVLDDDGGLVHAFDLHNDPGEENDLAADGRPCPPHVAALAERLAEFRAATPRDMTEPWRHDIPYPRWNRNPLREPMPTPATPPPANRRERS